MSKNVFLRFKWIAGSVLGLAFVTITGVNVHLSLKGQKDSNYSDVMLKNIGALSSDESNNKGQYNVEEISTDHYHNGYLYRQTHD